MGGKRWTLEQDLALKQYYPHLPTEHLLPLFPDKSWDACKLRANKLKLKRYYNLNRSNNIGTLLENTLEAYYWMGFLYADGHFNFGQKRIIVSLAIKDKEHLQKAAKFLNTSIRKEDSYKVTLTAANVEYFQSIINKFKIKERKTYNPPDSLSFLNTDEQFLAFIIGFIDGDGNIRNQYNRKDCTLTIQVHNSWKHILLEIEERTYKLSKTISKKVLTKTNKAGYALLCFSNHKILNFLKRKAQELNLPYLKRKWDLINLDKVYRDSSGELKETVLQLYKSGMTQKQIALKLNKSKGYICQIVHSRK